MVGVQRSPVDNQVSAITFRFAQPLGNYWGAFIKANYDFYLTYLDGSLVTVSMMNRDPLGTCKDVSSQGL
jgi:hypothetical protein